VIHYITEQGKIQTGSIKRELPETKNALGKQEETKGRG
jgi:hypothetical protein